MVYRLGAWGAPSRGLVFGPLSIGDDLLCTAVLREARRRGTPFTMFSARPELFLGNPDPAAVRPIDDHYIALLRRLRRKVVAPYYGGIDPANPDRDVLPPRHIIAEMCRLAGIRGEVALRPYLPLRSDELDAAPRLPRQIAIQSTAAAAAVPFANKEWGAERFARLVGLLSRDYSFVQIGSKNDPALPGVAMDLRGRTTLREAAAVQANSLLFVGLEGFLGHLARAVDCPAVILLGGRATPAQVGYIANLNLHATTTCAPCGFRSQCEHGIACLRQVSPECAADAVVRLASRPRHPLPVETANL